MCTVTGARSYSDNLSQRGLEVLSLFYLKYNTEVENNITQ